MSVRTGAPSSNEPDSEVTDEDADASTHYPATTRRTESSMQWNTNVCVCLAPAHAPAPCRVAGLGEGSADPEQPSAGGRRRRRKILGHFETVFNQFWLVTTIHTGELLKLTYAQFGQYSQASLSGQCSTSI